MVCVEPPGLHLAYQLARAPGQDVAMCHGLGCEHEDRYDGACAWNGRGQRPCIAWDDDGGREDDACEGEGEEEC